MAKVKCEYCDSVVDVQDNCPNCGAVLPFVDPMVPYYQERILQLEFQNAISCAVRYPNGYIYDCSQLCCSLSEMMNRHNSSILSALNSQNVV